MGANLEILGLLAVYLLLTGLPAAAAALLASRAGVRSVPLLLAIALAASGSTAILCFWLYYGTPAVGETASFFFAFASVGAIAWCWRQGIDRDVLRQLATPFALWALASAFIVFLGFFHGGSGEPLATASIRFSHQLPSDNMIPAYFADYFYLHGHLGTPSPFGDWLSSDRPPLQIGYMLAQRPFGWDGSGLRYEVLGLVVQQLWILGLWALLCAARLTPRTRGLVAFAAIVSDIAIVHAFFVWPKLIAAAFLLAALAMVLSDDWRSLQRRPWGGALFAVLCALSFLAHGSSAFFILPLLLAAAWRGIPNPAWIGVAIAAGIVLLAPWSAYQRFADPPGNRLLKWQLGGSLPIDDRGALETIGDAYREIGVGGTLDNKWKNLTQLVGQADVDRAVDEAVDLGREGSPGKAIIALRLPRFYDLLPFLGLLLVGPVALVVAWLAGRRPRGPDLGFALFGLAFTAFTCLVWALLIFGGPEASTSLHQGSLAVPLLALSACVASACAVDHRFGAALVVANVALVLLLLVPAVGPVPGTSYSVLAGLLATAALVGIAVLTLRLLRNP
jgi:hypothetical protein